MASSWLQIGGTYVTLTNDIGKNIITDWMVMEDDFMSDHKCLRMKLKLGMATTTLKRSWSKIDWHQFKNLLDDEFDYQLLDSWSLDMLEAEAKILTDYIQNVLEEVAPLKIIPAPKGRPTWWSENISALKHHVRSALGLAYRLSSDHLWEEYHSE